MTTRSIKLSRIALLLGFAGLIPVQGAQAALITPAVNQTFPDITLGNSYLVYDHDGGGPVNGSVGQLRVIVNSTSLTDGPPLGAGDPDTQSYSAYTSVLTVNVNNSTGAFLGGSVNIVYGVPTTQPQYSWLGTITNFGFISGGAGRIFDATWTVTGDTYNNMPTGLSSFYNGYLTGGTGGIIISSTQRLGVLGACTAPVGSLCLAGTPTFGNDWILGANAEATGVLGTLAGPGGFITGLTAPIRMDSAVTADVFATPVPEASTYGMMLVGLAMLAPLVRRKKLSK